MDGMDGNSGKSCVAADRKKPPEGMKEWKALQEVMTKFFSTESDTVNAELNPPEILFQSELRS